MATQVEVASPPALNTHVHPPVTKHKRELESSLKLRQKTPKTKPVPYFNVSLVEYADIPILDFSDFERPGGKEKLVAQLKEAVQQTGRSVPLFMGFLEAERQSEGKDDRK